MFNWKRSDRGIWLKKWQCCYVVINSRERYSVGWGESGRLADRLGETGNF